MRSAVFRAALMCLCVLVVGCDAGPQAYSFFTSRQAARSASVAGDVRVMSFNLRRQFILDGLNHWNYRKQYVVQTINRFRPDLLGTQECQPAQARYLRENLPGYRFVGVGRNDGKNSGEMCGIFFRNDKFTKLDEGHFWLSKTPDKPGSKSWGSSYKRMVSWVKLKPRSGGAPLFFFNTHLDNSAADARVHQAWLLRKEIDQIADGQPTIVTGDFNTDAGTTPYQLLVKGPEDWRGHLVDTYHQINPAPSHDDGTRHNFHGGTGGDRIDWIMTTDNFATLDANIDHTEYHGRYPSDHFPVTAILRRQPGSQFAGHRTAAFTGGS